MENRVNSEKNYEVVSLPQDWFNSYTNNGTELVSVRLPKQPGEGYKSFSTSSKFIKDSNEGFINVSIYRDSSITVTESIRNGDGSFQKNKIKMTGEELIDIYKKRLKENEKTSIFITLPKECFSEPFIDNYGKTRIKVVLPKNQMFEELAGKFFYISSCMESKYNKEMNCFSLPCHAFEKKDDGTFELTDKEHTLNLYKYVLNGTDQETGKNLFKTELFINITTMDLHSVCAKYIKSLSDDKANNFKDESHITNEEILDAEQYSEGDLGQFVDLGEMGIGL